MWNRRLKRKLVEITQERDEWKERCGQYRGSAHLNSEYLGKCMVKRDHLLKALKHAQEALAQATLPTLPSNTVTRTVGAVALLSALSAIDEGLESVGESSG